MSAVGDRLHGAARQAALPLPDVSHGYPFTPGLDVYRVAGKVFLIVTDDPDEQIVTVKCEPEHARAQERGYATRSRGVDVLLAVAADVARRPAWHLVVRHGRGAGGRVCGQRSRGQSSRRQNRTAEAGPSHGDGPASSAHGVYGVYGVYGVMVTPGAISAVPLVSFPEPVAPSELTKRSSWLVPPALPTASRSVD